MLHASGAAEGTVLRSLTHYLCTANKNPENSCIAWQGTLQECGRLAKQVTPLGVCKGWRGPSKLQHEAEAARSSSHVCMLAPAWVSTLTGPTTHLEVGWLPPDVSMGRR